MAVGGIDPNQIISIVRNADNNNESSDDLGYSISSVANQILPMLISGNGVSGASGASEVAEAKQEVDTNTRNANNLKQSQKTGFEKNNAQMQIILDKLNQKADEIQEKLDYLNEMDIKREDKEQELKEQRKAIEDAAKTLNESDDLSERQKALAEIKSAQGAISSLAAEVESLKSEAENLNSQIETDNEQVSTLEAQGNQQGQKTQSDLKSDDKKADTENKNNEDTLNKAEQNKTDAKEKELEAASVAETDPIESARLKLEAEQLKKAGELRETTKTPQQTVQTVKTQVGKDGAQTNANITGVGSSSADSQNLVQQCTTLLDSGIGWITNNAAELTSQADGELPKATDEAEDKLEELAAKESDKEKDTSDGHDDKTNDTDNKKEEIFLYNVDKLNL